MAIQMVEIEGIGPVRLVKRAGVKNIRITISREGQLRVSMPRWVSYKYALNYIDEQREWIEAHLPKHKEHLTDGYRVGKAHQLHFEQTTTSKVTTKVKDQLIRVCYAAPLTIENPLVQVAARRAAIKALRAEAETLLPQRLDHLAKTYGFSYKSVTVKHLKARWGSCSSKGDLTLNIFLMQLPWHLIDYVLLHELTHTAEMSHQPAFWNRLKECLPSARALAKEIKQYHPTFLS